MQKKRGTTRQQQRTTAETENLDVFRYHDYRVFLKDWLAMRRASQSEVSLREFARHLSISPSLLSMILSGSRKLMSDSLPAISSVLNFLEDEREYFRCLLILCDSDFPGEKQDAYRRMHQMLSYKKTNPDENRTYEYFSHWYYIVIREMADLEDFQLDPDWIQRRLKSNISLREIKQALEFLVTHGLIKASASGKNKSSEQLDCKGDIYRLALSRFHKEMFSLASDAVETVSHAERNILGYTAAVDENQFKDIRKLLDEVQRQIAEITQRPGKRDRIIHVELALFPLTGTE